MIQKNKNNSDIGINEISGSHPAINEWDGNVVQAERKKIKV